MTIKVVRQNLRIQSTFFCKFKALLDAGASQWRAFFSTSFIMYILPPSILPSHQQHISLNFFRSERHPFQVASSVHPSVIAISRASVYRSSEHFTLISSWENGLYLNSSRLGGCLSVSTTVCLYLQPCLTNWVPSNSCIFNLIKLFD